MPPPYKFNPLADIKLNPLDRPPDGSVTPEQRAKSIQFRNSQLADPKRIPSAMHSNGPEVFNSDNVPQYGSADDYNPDPTGEFAIHYLRQLYPQLMNSIDSLHTGVKMLLNEPGTLGVTNVPMRHISIKDSKGNFPKAMSVGSHELAHMAGAGEWEENGVPGAYDVGSATDDINSDVWLKPDPKNARAAAIKSALPTIMRRKK